jgi:hypothetical protein
MEKINMKKDIKTIKYQGGLNMVRSNEKIAKEFLNTLYGKGRAEDHLAIWTKQDKRSYFFTHPEFNVASKKAISLSQDMDVYYGIGLQREEPTEGGRGREDAVISIPGLWLDIDVKGPNHRAKDLPVNKSSVKQVLDMFPLKPTMVVTTGGGLHTYWLFKEPMILSKKEKHKMAKDLSAKFQAMFRYLAAQKGWRIDNTSDLSRLLRLPGTYNHKSGDPVPVEIGIHIDSNRYDPFEIAEALKEFEMHETINKEDDSEPIEEGARNTTLTSIGGKLRAQNNGYDQIYQELIKINQTRCVPPLSDEEVDGIARSVSEYEVNDDQNNRRETQSDRLVKIADNMLLFHTGDGECYAEIPINEHEEIWPVRSNQLRDYLAKSYYEQYCTAPGAQGLQNALNVLKGRAKFDAPEKQVFVRLAPFEDSIYLDLCNENWEVVNITLSGWEITKNPPVAFLRQKGMLALPRPIRGGSLNELRNVINVKKLNEWVLIVSWLIGALSPSGPYPILIVHGEQGSAKSTTARILRALIDPASSPLKTLPRNDRDLMIHAKNNWIIAFDNLSGLSRSMSDTLCRLSTGGGFSTRGLYSDSDEVIFDAMRPMILNGIDNIASRNDLADRALIVNLPRIPENKRKRERVLWNDFDLIKPKVLGALLDAVSHGLKYFKDVKLDKLPRMADFAQWIVAAEPKLPWEAGKFMEIYRENRDEAKLSIFESDNVAIALKAFIEGVKKWKGTATQLKRELEQYTQDDELVKSRYWPKAPNKLSERVRRIADSLRSIGIQTEFVTAGKIWKFNSE